MKLKKYVLCAVGVILLGIGAVGAVVPLLPAFPFLLGALFCFAKSSDKLHTWFVNSRLYKNNLESYVNNHAMTVKTKVTLVVSLSIAMGIGFFAMSRVPVGRIVLAVVWIVHVLYFVFGIKTVRDIPDGK